MDWSLEAVTVDCTRLSFLKALELADLRNSMRYIRPGNTQQDFVLAKIQALEIYMKCKTLVLV